MNYHISPPIKLPADPPFSAQDTINLMRDGLKELEAAWANLSECGMVWEAQALDQAMNAICRIQTELEEG
jgi:hypothetical protein